MSMSKNLRLRVGGQDVTFNNVRVVTFEGENDPKYFDTLGTTATSRNVAFGKIFFDVDGNMQEGQVIGGGSIGDGVSVDALIADGGLPYLMPTKGTQNTDDYDIVLARCRAADEQGLPGYNGFVFKFTGNYTPTGTSADMPIDDSSVRPLDAIRNAFYIYRS